MSELKDGILASESSGDDISKLDTSIPGNDEWNQKYTRLREIGQRIATNCEEIISISADILENQSKDLRIAAYLCRGLFHHKEYSGLLEGLEIYHLLLEKFWEKGLHPQNVAARANNITLLDKNLLGDMGLKKDVKANREILEAIKGILENIKAFLKEKNPDKNISFQSVNAEIDKLLNAAPKPQTAVKSPPGSAVSTAKSETQPSTATVPLESGLKSEMDAIKSLIQLARFLFERDIKNVISYRILRAVFWHLFVPPEPDENGKRFVMYSEAPNKAHIENLLKDEDWISAVKECENSLISELENGGFSLCLDIQRFLSLSLRGLVNKFDRLGDNKERNAYDNLNKLILHETAMIIERFPFITDILYKDQKTPFADSLTKRWIEESVKSTTESSQADKPKMVIPETDSEDEKSRIQEDFDKAQELLSKRKLGEAFEIMQNGIDTEPTRKGRFLRRLNLASLCLDASQPRMARPILEQLDIEIERFALDQWEPGLCVQVWSRLKNCYQLLMAQQKNTDGYYQEKSDKIFEKICQLDIRVAQTVI